MIPIDPLSERSWASSIRLRGSNRGKKLEMADGQEREAFLAHATGVIFDDIPQVRP
jgi:hypothetical protein